MAPLTHTQPAARWRKSLRSRVGLPLLLALLVHRTPVRAQDGGATPDIVTPEQQVTALLPSLDTEDVELKQQIHRLLGSIDGTTAGRPADFSVYRRVIVSQKEGPPLGLVRYMYQIDPEAAFTTMSDVYLTDNDTRSTLLRGLRQLAEARKKQQAGTLTGDERTATVQQLDRFATQGAWWIRLYAAEVWRREPSFRNPSTIKRLLKDPDTLVQETAASIAAEKPSATSPQASAPMHPAER